MICYWIGDNFDNMPTELNSYLSGKFDISNCGQDFSVITQKDVNLLIFCLNSENVGFFNTCIKVCEHLDKKLITLSFDNTKPEQNQLNYVYFHSDMKEKGAVVHFHNSLKQLFNHLQNNNKLTFQTFNDQLPGESGTKIDIYRTVEFIDNNIEKKITEEEMAQKSGYSAPYFSKIFKETVGTGFRDYITNKRVSRAKHFLVINKEEKIASVAYQCGYNDVSYFSRIFKKKTGLSPGEYRRQYLN